ncbi:MmcQ/YjbR family DNA-binding protein [Streptomyces sp. NPDC004539]|uniref:MmcQ/YjbR family DNA-binding protein n=1 Tax=Streptomyces sp. NPDC004539 TaxID=3154280 RepID=UPI0033BF2152
MTLTGVRLQQTARRAAGALPGTGSSRPFTEKLDVYKVAGKVFLIVTDDPGERIITVKAEPEHGRRLREEYPSITAGRYLDKKHWISVSGGRDVTAALVEDLVTDSYDLALDSAPRSRRPAART